MLESSFIPSLLLSGVCPALDLCLSVCLSVRVFIWMSGKYTPLCTYRYFGNVGWSVNPGLVCSLISPITGPGGGALTQSAGYLAAIPTPNSSIPFTTRSFGREGGSVGAEERKTPLSFREMAGEMPAHREQAPASHGLHC